MYIYDYLMKRNLHASAKAFQAEGKVSVDPVGKSIPRFAKGNKYNIYSMDPHGTF